MELGAIGKWVNKLTDRISPRQPQQVESESPSPFQADSWVAGEMADLQSQLKCYLNEGTIHGRPATVGEGFQETLEVYRAKMHDLEKSDSGTASLYARDANIAPGEVRVESFDERRDATFTGSSNGNFSYTQVVSNFSEYGVPFHESSSVVYDGKTLTVLENSEDGYGEGQTRARSFTAEGSSGEFRLFG